MAIVVRVQEADFDAGVELRRLRVGKPAVGAIASFLGIVRDHNAVGDEAVEIGTLTLEHYPGMTERSLEAICAAACERWALVDLIVIHRIGALAPTDQIVFVAASASHRAAAFEACDFVMDYLKTEAPFWKKEATPDGERWVEARAVDREAVRRWDSGVRAIAGNGGTPAAGSDEAGANAGERDAADTDAADTDAVGKDAATGGDLLGRVEAVGTGPPADASPRSA